MEISLEGLEKLRKNARNKVIISVVSVAMIALILWSLESTAEIAPFIVGAMVVVLAIVCALSISKFSNAFKSSIVSNMLNRVFTNVVYSPTKGMPREVVLATELVYMGDRYKSNDFIQAGYKGVNFYQADVDIEEEVQSADSDGNSSTTYRTIFKGRWMIFEFNKTFTRNMQVCEKTFVNATRGGNGVFNRSYKKHEMEDIAFNNQFDTYVQDAAEAFYILTPSLMERIKKLNAMLRGSLVLGFINNRLHVAFHNNQDSFEHNIFVKIDLPKVEAKILGDIKVITSFVDELNLENDLFRKEGN